MSVARRDNKMQYYSFIRHMNVILNCNSAKPFYYRLNFTTVLLFKDVLT